MLDNCHGCKKPSKTKYYHSRGKLCNECGDKFSPKKQHNPSMQKMAEAIDSNDPFLIDECKLKELQGDGNFDWPSTAMRSNEGAHGGGVAYEQLKSDNNFIDKSDKSYEKKKKPGKSVENKIDPGDGETGEKPTKVTTPTGFKSSKQGLPKEKDSPGKVTKNTMPGESLDRELDTILESIPGQYQEFGGEPSALAEPQIPDTKKKA